jgi:hypothetical protein
LDIKLSNQHQMLKLVIVVVGNHSEVRWEEGYRGGLRRGLLLARKCKLEHERPLVAQVAW